MLIILALLLALALDAVTAAVTTGCISASNPSSDCCTGRIALDTSLTTIANNAFKDCTITSVSFDGLSALTSIGNLAFQGTHLANVTLDGLSSLTSIGVNAFFGSKITSVSFDGLTELTTIDQSAFSGTKLTSVSLDGLSKLTTIGFTAFTNTPLTSVSLNGLTSLTTIGQNAFSGLDDLRSVSFDGLTSLTTIGQSAFDNTALTSLSLKGLTELTTIGIYAFGGSKLTSLSLDGLTKLTTIGARAFKSTKLTCFELRGLASLTTVGSEAFGAITTLQTYILSDPSYKSKFASDAFASSSIGLDYTTDAAFCPTPTPTSKPTRTPTPEPTYQPTVQPSTPTWMPTTLPTRKPSASPTPEPTLKPTLAPVVEPTICAEVLLYDQFGDGWGNQTYLEVVGQKNTDNFYMANSGQCSSRVVSICKYESAWLSSKVAFGIHSDENSYRNEIFWALKYYGINYYFDSNSKVVIHGVTVVTNDALDREFNTCVSKTSQTKVDGSSKSKPKEKNPSKSDSKVEIELFSTDSKSWFVDSVDNGLISVNGFDVPMSMLYAKWQLYDDYDGKLIKDGSLCGLKTEQKVVVPLPEHGHFVYRVSGRGSNVKWNLCGISGSVNDQVSFTMRYGKCVYPRLSSSQTVCNENTAALM